MQSLIFEKFQFKKWTVGIFVVEHETCLTSSEQGKNLAKRENETWKQEHLSHSSKKEARKIQCNI